MRFPIHTVKDQLWHKYFGRPYRLHLTDSGGDGPVIVLLHGLASSSANWAELTPLLQAKYRCISLDLIGFGDSPKPDWYGYTMDDHMRSIHKTLNGLGLHQSYTLIGHSLGSLLATRYAREHSAAINHLILLSPPIYTAPGSIASRSARQRTSLYLRAYKYLRTHPRATPDNIIRLKRLLPQTKFLMLSQATWQPFIRSLKECIENQTMLDDIKHVSAPVDIFYGIFDEVIVAYNIKQIAKTRAVTLHPLRVSHMVGKRYATAVATSIAQTATERPS